MSLARTGTQTHLGNLPLREERAGDRLHELRSQRADLANVRSYIDTSRWLTDKSDVVALLVLEHQTQLQNMMTRMNYKVRTVMSREEPPVPMARGPRPRHVAGKTSRPPTRNACRR